MASQRLSNTATTLRFQSNGGGKQTLTFNGIEFVGYGQPNDFQGRDLKDKLVVTIPNLAPPAAGQGGRWARTAATPPVHPPLQRSGSFGRRNITPAAATRCIPGGNAPRGGAARGGAAGAIALGAKAAIGFTATPAAPGTAEQALTQAQAALAQANAAVAQAQQALRAESPPQVGVVPSQPAAGRGAQPAAPPILTTVQRVDGIVTPQFTGDETFFEALFDGGSVKFADILAAARRGDADCANHPARENHHQYRQYV